MEPELTGLTDRRCEECDCYMAIVDRSPAGALTLYRCPLGHVLLVDSHGHLIRGTKPS